MNIFNANYSLCCLKHVNVIGLKFFLVTFMNSIFIFKNIIKKLKPKEELKQ